MGSTTLAHLARKGAGPISEDAEAGVAQVGQHHASSAHQADARRRRACAPLAPLTSSTSFVSKQTGSLPGTAQAWKIRFMHVKKSEDEDFALQGCNA